MGMFTWVKPAKGILPDQYKDQAGWQTKDVVDPDLETLEITENGELYHIWQRYEWKDNSGSILGGYFYPISEQREKLNYSGDMRFYTLSEDKGPLSNTHRLILLVARFTNGKLEQILEAAE